MLDLARLTEMVGGVLGQDAADFGTDDLLQQLSDAGLDPAQLQGLAPDELLTMLSENGIDPAEFDLAGLTEMFGSEGAGQTLGEGIRQFAQR